MTPSDQEVLDAIERFWDLLVGGHAAPYPYQDALLREKYTQDQIYEHMEDMAARDIIDYGVSVRTAWIRMEHAAGRSRNAVEGK